MESSLKNMILTLLAITFVSASAVGLVNKVTEGPREEARVAKVTSAIAQVLPKFDNEPGETKQVLPVDGKDVIAYTATKDGEPVGYAIETFTNAGFGGEIKLMVGFLPDGSIYKVETLSHNETPGLGDKIESKKSDFAVQFEGKNPLDYKLSVKKDGGDIDAIAASTITTRAFADAVDRAYKVFQTVNSPETNGEAGGATVSTAETAVAIATAEAENDAMKGGPDHE